MSLLTLRDGILAGFTEAFAEYAPKKVKVSAHDGRFGVEDMRRYGADAPAIVVALLGIPRIGPAAGLIRMDTRWAAFVVTNDVGSLKRGPAALAIVGALARVIPGNTFGADDASEPSDVQAENLFSAEIDRHGIALWGVTWTQQLHVKALDDAELEAFELMEVEYHLDQVDDPPAAEANDRVELEQ